MVLNKEVRGRKMILGDKIPVSGVEIGPQKQEIMGFGVEKHDPCEPNSENWCRKCT